MITIRTARSQTRSYMEPRVAAIAALLCIGIGVSFADDPMPLPAPTTATPPGANTTSTNAVTPAAIPRTHTDTTVVGDASAPADLDSGQPAAASLDTDHHFEAGAPAIMEATKSLRLSAQQKAKIHQAIEESDAGAAVLIRRENAVQQMMAATTPESPTYAQLRAEQGTAQSRWIQNRTGLRQAVVDVLTPAQREKFEQANPKP